ncbi:hypothetical protein [Denitratisoma oestradiolicum]|uniref:Ornithine cyclodeaminase n=1 Tax=Denitratisoma oestradiolicum TaxID=311182 RepID=A0A6S6XTP6_9PROT|nr:hypothetical protein [Denitratisoma oestradiolicum]TWO80275.1 hypothetical protein CBW56_10715 [Denitratisoma oestradiolicum]CAB1369370.1 conserved protein of unknown function [Denitratisoma oestradiolicum]
MSHTDDLLLRFIAPAPEPCRYLGDVEIHQTLLSAPANYLDFLWQRLSAVADGSISLQLPEKQIFEDGPLQGDFRIMPCITLTNGVPFKTVKVVGTNLNQRIVPGQITVGKAMVLDPVENFVTHMADANLLSSLRTGACAALAMRSHHAGQGCLRIVGAGKVGTYTALLALETLAFSELRLTDRNQGRVQELAELLRHRHPGVAIKMVEPGAMARGEDVVVLTTTSEAPFFSPRHTDAPLVISLGADSRHQRELTDDWVSAAELCCESLDSMDYGDLLAWRDGGLLDGDLPTAWLARLAGRVSDDADAPGHQRQVFISTGSALMDNLTLNYLLAQL